MVEQLPVKELVPGSSPGRGARRANDCNPIARENTASQSNGRWSPGGIDEVGYLSCYFALDFLRESAHCTDGLIFLSARWMQPIQQQGRRIPSLSSEMTRSTCSSLVFCCFTLMVQQIHSLRASGVISSHSASALGSALRALRRSSGNVCTTPLATSLVAICTSYQMRNLYPIY
jgi:hypothetical protein